MRTLIFSPTLSLVHVTIFWLARHQKMATRALTVDIFVWESLTTHRKRTVARIAIVLTALSTEVRLCINLYALFLILLVYH